MPMKERRIYERFQLSLPARLEMNSTGKKEIFELQTREELIVASERIKELTGVQGLIKVEGTIVRSTPDGLAICFDGDCEILGLKES
jgi:hypothetical protein